jgi:hypothetical protein
MSYNSFCKDFQQPLPPALLLVARVSRTWSIGPNDKFKQVKRPPGAQEQNFINIKGFRFLSCMSPFMIKGRGHLLQSLLTLASAVILGSESCGNITIF